MSGEKSGNYKTASLSCINLDRFDKFEFRMETTTEPDGTHWNRKYFLMGRKSVGDWEVIQEYGDVSTYTMEQIKFEKTYVIINIFFLTRFKLFVKI